MSLPVVLGDEASAESDAAVDWHEQRSGRGAESVARVRQALERIGRPGGMLTSW